MYKLNLPQDPKEAAAIEARKKREKERQTRFLNVRNRVIGVDINALNKQVEEKKLQKKKEQSKEAAFANNQVQYDMVAQMLDKKEAEQRYRLAKQVQEFREQKQQLRNQREFDIWDPNRLKKEFPARVGDNDPRCGPSSLQCFSGEDLNRATRLRMQKEQLRGDLQRQLQEHHQARAQEKYADMLHDQVRLAMDVQDIHMARLEESCHRAKMATLANANKAQAAEVAERQHHEHKLQQIANLWDIQNHVTSDLLTENTQVARHRTDPNRVLTYCWKGMTPEQLAVIRKVQERQRHEKEMRRHVDYARERDWDRQAVCLAQAALKLEEQEKELRGEFQRGIGSLNQHLAKEQKAQHKYFKSTIHTKKPATQYFLQSHMRK